MLSLTPLSNSNPGNASGPAPMVSGPPTYTAVAGASAFHIGTFAGAVLKASGTNSNAKNGRPAKSPSSQTAPAGQAQDSTQQVVVPIAQPAPANLNLAPPIATTNAVAALDSQSFLLNPNGADSSAASSPAAANPSASTTALSAASAAPATTANSATPLMSPAAGSGASVAQSGLSATMEIDPTTAPEATSENPESQSAVPPSAGNGAISDAAAAGATPTGSTTDVATLNPPPDQDTTDLGSFDGQNSNETLAPPARAANEAGPAKTLPPTAYRSEPSPKIATPPIPVSSKPLVPTATGGTQQSDATPNPSADSTISAVDDSSNLPGGIRAQAPLQNLIVATTQDRQNLLEQFAAGAQSALNGSSQSAAVVSSPVGSTDSGKTSDRDPSNPSQSDLNGNSSGILGNDIASSLGTNAPTNSGDLAPKNPSPISAAVVVAAGPSAAAVQQALHAPVDASMQPAGAGSGSATANSTKTATDNRPLPSAPPTPASLNEVMRANELYQRVGNSEMHVAMQTDLLGVIDLHATMHQSTLTATIGVQRPDVQTLLATDLPALQHALADQHFHVEHISVLDTSVGTHTGAGGQQNRQQNLPAPPNNVYGGMERADFQVAREIEPAANSHSVLGGV
jgi:hypothetical protein